MFRSVWKARGGGRVRCALAVFSPFSLALRAPRSARAFSLARGSLTVSLPTGDVRLYSTNLLYLKLSLCTSYSGGSHGANGTNTAV